MADLSGMNHGKRLNFSTSNIFSPRIPDIYIYKIRREIYLEIKFFLKEGLIRNSSIATSFHKKINIQVDGSVKSANSSQVEHYTFYMSRMQTSIISCEYLIQLHFMHEIFCNICSVPPHKQ